VKLKTNVDKRVGRNHPVLKKHFVAMVMGCALVFSSVGVLIFVPQMSFIFDSFKGEANNRAAQAYVGQLESYIEAREHALYDLTSKDILINTILMNDGENTAFRDYISQIVLLGQNPGLIIIDAFGGTIFNELGYQKDGVGYRSWIEPLLSATEPMGLVRIRSRQPAQFEIAVPILYGQRAEGVLIAIVSAEPKTIYSAQVLEGESLKLSYRIGNQTIDYGLQHYGETAQKITGSRYPIEFSYVNHYSPTHKHKMSLMLRVVSYFLVAILLSSLVLIALGFRFIRFSAPETPEPTSDENA